MPDFAACLQLGLEPVGLVQGFCVMQWGWYGAGSSLMRGANPYTMGAQSEGAYSESYRCPHGYVSAEHRMWGQNLEQPWVEAAWSAGYGAAYARMLDEATALGAHGVIGVVDRVTPVADSQTSEFHFLGTAVTVEDGPPPAGGVPWTTYLAGQRLTKSIEAGFMPVAVVASMASVRVRQLARKHVRQKLVGDALHGVQIDVEKRELAQGDEVIDCTIRGNRVRRFKDFDVVPSPRPTVRLS